MRAAMAKTRAARQNFDQVDPGRVRRRRAANVASRPPCARRLARQPQNRQQAGARDWRALSRLSILVRVVGMRRGGNGLRMGNESSRARPFVTMLQATSLDPAARRLPADRRARRSRASTFRRPMTALPKVRRWRKPRCRRSTGGARFRSRELTEIIEAGARRQSRHRGRDRAHRAGRRAGAHHRRGAVADRQSRRPAPRARVPRRRSAAPASRPVASRARQPAGDASASYEIDFWGKNRAAVARGRRDRGRQPLRPRSGRPDAPWSTAANAYFQVLAAQDRLRVARENIASAQRACSS